MTPHTQLADDALRIWRAGVDGVQSAVLLRDFIAVDGNDLVLGDDAIDLRTIRRIAVVGAGKAAAEMAAAVENLLGEHIAQDKQLFGWVNAPEGWIASPRRIHVHAARPRGVNEPTPEAEYGALEILRIVGELTEHDLCIAVVSGGASALLPSPILGVALADKVELTRELSARGATIHELNAVRTALSRIKGGGLTRACRAGRLVAFILSDVPGDDLAVVGSGPTVVGSSDSRTAIEVLRKFGLSSRRIEEAAEAASPGGDQRVRPLVTNILIGNNAAAVDAAGIEAERLGYSHAMLAVTALEGDANDIGRQLVAMAMRMRSLDGPDCLITGGEPTVRLAPEHIRGRGGRNQQLALAALAAIDDWRGIALVAAGTDGEDGPTDAAGAWVDEEVVAEARALNLDPSDFLARNDAYSFFDAAGGLLRTGPAGTNVCDLRVVVVDKQRAPGH